MKLSIEIGAGKVTLNRQQMEDVLRGMSYALGGAKTAKQFGDVHISIEPEPKNGEAGAGTVSLVNQSQVFTDC